jgi:hypothetical protein
MTAMDANRSVQPASLLGATAVPLIGGAATDGRGLGRGTADAATTISAVSTVAIAQSVELTHQRQYLCMNRRTLSFNSVSGLSRLPS